ncbi:MAG: cell wall-binding repeat-containing protein, partial [Actinomycetota bacterium]|nr:cell wall-binding repeat-containing protein [Actinomycetota bacterium]
MPVSSPLDVRWGTDFPFDVPGYATLGSGTRVNPPASGVLDLGTLRVAPKQNPHGAIFGKVTDSFTGNGTWAVGVRAFRLNEADGSWSQVVWVQANPDGNYALIGTESRPLVGKVKLQFEKLTGVMAPIGWYSKGDSLASARVINVAPGSAVYGVDYTATIPGQMRGTVLWAKDLRPHRGSVQVYGPDWIGGSGLDRNGVYVEGEHFGMPGGTYIIEVPSLMGSGDPTVFYGQSATAANAKRVTLPEGGHVDNLDIYLSHDAALVGRVADPDGEDLPDVLVRAFKLESGAWRNVGSRFTDAHGRYSFMVGSAGTYTLSFADTLGTSDTRDDKLFYLGGASSISSAGRVSVRASSASVAPTVVMTPSVDSRTTRLWGENRYETAIAASRSAFPDGGATSALLATGETFPDALSGAGLAGAVDAPILLTRKQSLYLGLLEEFDRLGVSKIYVLGGESAISARQVGLLVSLGYEVERIAGVDRYATSAAIARKIDEHIDVDETTPVFVVSGASYADALAVGPAAFAAPGIVLLVSPTQVPSEITRVVRSLDLGSGFAVGGPAALSNSVLASLGSAGLPTVRSVSGSDRYATAASFATFSEQRGWLDGREMGLAVGTNFADALAAGPAMGRARGAVVLSQTTTLPRATADVFSARRARIKSINV